MILSSDLKLVIELEVLEQCRRRVQHNIVLGLYNWLLNLQSLIRVGGGFNMALSAVLKTSY